MRESGPWATFSRFLFDPQAIHRAGFDRIERNGDRLPPEIGANR